MSKQENGYNERRFQVTIIVDGITYVQDSFLALDLSEAMAFAAFRAHLTLPESEMTSGSMERYANGLEEEYSQPAPEPAAS